MSFDFRAIELNTEIFFATLLFDCELKNATNKTKQLKINLFAC